MASLTKHSNGSWMIQFTLNKKRRTIYPGKMPKKNAQTFRIHVEALVAARKSGTSMPGATAEWVQGNADVRPKLHKVGLIEAEPEIKDCPSLGDFVQKFEVY